MSPEQIVLLFTSSQCSLKLIYRLHSKMDIKTKCTTHLSLLFCLRFVRETTAFASFLLSCQVYKLLRSTWTQPPLLVGFSSSLCKWVRQSRAQPKPPLSLSIEGISVVVGWALWLSWFSQDVSTVEDYNNVTPQWGCQHIICVRTHTYELYLKGYGSR